MDHSECKILVIGKTGSGASSSGNTILRQNVFESARGFSSVTDSWKSRRALVGGRPVTVFDTPNFFNSACSNIDREIESVLRSSSGLHAILLVLLLHTFTRQEVEVLKAYKKTFGKEALKYTIVLFTHGDELQSGSSVEELIGQHREISAMVVECGSRYQVFNNKDPSNRQQVTELLSKIERMVASNENRCYTLEMFLCAQSIIARFKRIIKTVVRINRQYLILVALFSGAVYVLYRVIVISPLETPGITFPNHSPGGRDGSK